MLTLALLAPAFALVAKEACMGFFVADSVPRPAATEVPVDVVPTVIVEDDGCVGASELDLEFFRYDEGQGTLLGTTRVALPGFGPQVVSVDLASSGGALQAQTNYLVRVVPVDGVAEVSAIGFTTGEGTLAGLSGVPSLRMISADAFKSDGVWTVSGEVVVDPVADPDGLSIAVVPSPDGDRLLFADVLTEDLLFGDFYSLDVEDVPDELCLRVEQRDGAQRSTGLSDADCLAVDKHRSLRGGCAVAPGGLSAWAALASLLLVGRRRR